MMSGSNKPLVFSFLLFFCMSTSFNLRYTSVVCPQIEKQALLKFKQSLEDPSNLLSSWNITSENNCCLWKGVVCSNLTGHVHQLHLQNPDELNPDEFEAGLRGEVNPSLLHLKELQYLDLSGNDFGVSIPSFFGLLTSLEYLNLSFAGFHGRIPHGIGNLSNLHTLSLDGFGVLWESDDGLGVDSMEWLSGLSGLEYLSMNEVNLSKAENWVEVINTLPSLLHLQLTYCSLNSMPPFKHLNTTSLSILDLSANDFDSLPMPTWVFHLPSLVELYLGSCLFKPPLTVSDFNSTSLTILDLSGNFFDSFPMPTWIFQHPNLIFLDLTSSGLEGPIPSVSNTTKLKYIHLSDNNINSSIPDWLYLCKHLESVYMSYNSLQNTISNAIGNLTSLNTLDLSYNQLSGNIPRQIASLCNLQMLQLSGNMLGGEISDSFGNMSDCFLEGVTSLYLKYNKLCGHLTPQFGEFKSLQNLYLSQNSISGAIPTHLGNLSSLEDLALGNNNLTGNLPESLGQLLNLGDLDIEYNMLEGMVTETHFSNLSKLSYLEASGNHLSMKISSNWVPPFKLYTLNLGSWNLGADNNIPSWIERHKSITWRLDLSNTGISGNIPSWFWEIKLLNLSHNNLQGQIPDINGLVQVYLSCNQFSGSLPRIADNVLALDLSNNSFTAGLSHFLCDPTNQTYDLRILHLGGNQLTGELPDCLMKWSSLVMLNLANNKLSGNIPNSIGFLADLRSLNLHGNKFWGQIPFSMHKCTKLLKLDLGGNGLAGNIPAWTVTSSAKLMFLILRSNKLSGEIPSDICHLNALQILDLSDNAFSGVIPKCINNFTAMATKRSLDDYGRELSGIDHDVFKGRRNMYYSYYSGLFHESASVATKGREYEYDTILSLVTNIDLSNNNLSGDIPKELMSLVELRSVNFSGNRLTGSIPDGMGDMKQLESLDLSRNSLMGEIPNSFTLMFSLNYLDLSFNNLTGRIPSSTQLLGMNESSFAGNDLCGPPLPNNCSNGDPPVGGDAHDDEGHVESKIDWFYVFSSLGYAVGLSACCTALMLKKSWRDAYYGLLECIWNKLYVYFCIKWTRLTATRAPVS